jgi:hypothetical protein
MSKTAAADQKTAQEPKTTTVRLTKPHRHAGRDYPASTEGRPSVLTLREDKANWLVANGVAEPVTTAPSAPAKAAPAA